MTKQEQDHQRLADSIVKLLKVFGDDSSSAISMIETLLTVDYFGAEYFQQLEPKDRRRVYNLTKLVVELAKQPK